MQSSVNSLHRSIYELLYDFTDDNLADCNTAVMAVQGQADRLRDALRFVALTRKMERQELLEQRCSTFEALLSEGGVGGDWQCLLDEVYAGDTMLGKVLHHMSTRPQVLRSSCNYVGNEFYKAASRKLISKTDTLRQLSLVDMTRIVTAEFKFVALAVFLVTRGADVEKTNLRRQGIDENRTAFCQQFIDLLCVHAVPPPTTTTTCRQNLRNQSALPWGGVQLANETSSHRRQQQNINSPDEESSESEDQNVVLDSSNFSSNHEPVEVAQRQLSVEATEQQSSASSSEQSIRSEEDLPATETLQQITAGLSLSDGSSSSHREDSSENSASIVSFAFDEDEEDECPTCMDKTKAVIYEPCHHSFCFKCDEDWVKVQKGKQALATCPMCRGSILSRTFT